VQDYHTDVKQAMAVGILVPGLKYIATLATRLPPQATQPASCLTHQLVIIWNKKQGVRSSGNFLASSSSNSQVMWMVLLSILQQFPTVTVYSISEKDTGPYFVLQAMKKLIARESVEPTLCTICLSNCFSAAGHWLSKLYECRTNIWKILGSNQCCFS